MRTPATRQRSQRHQRAGLVEVVCVAVALIVVIALGIWIVTHAGGGVLNQG